MLLMYDDLKSNDENPLNSLVVVYFLLPPPPPIIVLFSDNNDMNATDGNDIIQFY